MSDPKNDITTSFEANDADILDLKKAHFAQAGNDLKTRIAAPVAEQPKGLNQELLNMLKIGKRYANFQGLDRCIRILEPNTVNQRHCGSMMVKNLSTNMLMCTNCDRIKDPNARPMIINSSMIRLNDKELKECGLDHDPLLNAKSDPIPQPKKSRQKDAKVAESKPRRTIVKTPNKVSIEMSMDELKKNPNVLAVMLQKTLDAIYELPVSNFREAEEIRVVKDRVEEFLNQQAEPGQGE